MMFIPLKWTLKTDLYGHIMDHMNSGSTVSTPYRNQSIYFPYGVPIVPIMSLKVDIFSKISTLRCRYNVHVVHIWFIFEEKKCIFFSFSFLLLLLLLPYWILFRPLYKANIFLAFLFLNFYIPHMPVFASISISNF